MKLLEVRPLFFGECLEFVEIERWLDDLDEALLFFALGRELEEINPDFDEKVSCLTNPMSF